MTVSYDKLWKILIDKKMNKTDLKMKSGISFNIISKLTKEELVSMESMRKICMALNCDIGDVMEFKSQGEQV